MHLWGDVLDSIGAKVPAEVDDDFERKIPLSKLKINMRSTRCVFPVANIMQRKKAKVFCQVSIRQLKELVMSTNNC